MATLREPFFRGPCADLGYTDRRYTSDQFKVLFAVYCQWQLCDRPLSLRVRPVEIGRLCDLSVSEVHWILNQLVQSGYLDAQLAADLDGFRVTIAPVSQLRD